MGKEKALDVKGVEIKGDDLVKIVGTPIVKHGWLKVGNTLRVVRWENRPFGKGDYIVVFLKSKKGGNHCSIGVQDKSLMVIEG